MPDLIIVLELGGHRSRAPWRTVPWRKMKEPDGKGSRRGKANKISKEVLLEVENKNKKNLNKMKLNKIKNQKLSVFICNFTLLTSL